MGEANTKAQDVETPVKILDIQADKQPDPLLTVTALVGDREVTLQLWHSHLENAFTDTENGREFRKRTPGEQRQFLVDEVRRHTQAVPAHDFRHLVHAS